MVTTTTVKLNGKTVKATYRNESTDAAYIRVMAGEKGSRKLTTISGKVDTYGNFLARGQNAHLAATV